MKNNCLKLLLPLVVGLNWLSGCGSKKNNETTPRKTQQTTIQSNDTTSKIITAKKSEAKPKIKFDPSVR